MNLFNLQLVWISRNSSICCASWTYKFDCVLFLTQGQLMQSCWSWTWFSCSAWLQILKEKVRVIFLFSILSWCLFSLAVTVVVVVTVVTVAFVVLTVRLSLQLLSLVFVVVGAPICKVGLQRQCLVRLDCVTVTVSDSCTVTQWLLRSICCATLTVFFFWLWVRASLLQW